MSEYGWVNMTGAVRALGLSEDTIRRRIQAGKMQSKRDNRGRLLILAPTQEQTHTASEPQESTQEPTQGAAKPIKFLPHAAADDLTQPDANVRLIDHLLRQVEQEKAEREKLEARHDAELERQRAQHLSEIKRLETAYRAATDALMNRVSAILIANRPRPWWRFW